MGSASRVALAHTKSALSAEPLGAEAGADLLSASAQVGQSLPLLNALVDFSADATAKGQLVERLFASASAGARSVLTTAVAQSWSSPEELVAGIEELGLRAAANSYSNLADELLAAAAVVDSSHDLELTLGSKLGSVDGKLSLVEALFAAKVSGPALTVIRHLVANPRGRKLSPALRESARIAADQGGSELATVTVAAPLSEAQQLRISDLLAASAGRPVRITTIVDPALVGGVRIQIGEDVIDGSVKSRLEDLRLQLAG